MNPFIPEFEGEIELTPVPDDFIARIRRRIEQGLFRPGIRSRANYSVRSEGRDEITFGADDLLTAYNVGLNDVRVHRSSSNRVRYHVTFWRWTWTAVGHGGILGLVFLVAFVAFEGVRRHIAAYAYGPIIFLVLAVFFCLLWPWILTAMHRRFAEKALRGILLEVLNGSRA